jgi:hypothetical protein
MSTSGSPKTKKFQFIKITDNRNYLDFHIDITTMKNSRLRISALKAQHKKYINDGKNKKAIFRYFNLDYSFCVIEIGYYTEYSAVKKRRDELFDIYTKKAEGNYIPL